MQSNARIGKAEKQDKMKQQGKQNSSKIWGYLVSDPSKSMSRVLPSVSLGSFYILKSLKVMSKQWRHQGCAGCTG